MGQIFIVEWGFIETRPGSHINLTADNGFDSGLNGFAIKFHNPEQCSVIGNTYGLHVKLGRPPQKVGYADGTI